MPSCILSICIKFVKFVVLTSWLPCRSTSVPSFDDKRYPWNFPLIPRHLPNVSELMFNNPQPGFENKLIPRHLWMAFKDVPKESEMKDYLRKMFKKNSERNWTIHLADNDQKLNFMEKYFNNTSLLWAYKIIHPKVGNSAADIWRYGVLWMLGGLYMDDDSYFEAAFDDVR